MSSGGRSEGDELAAGAPALPTAGAGTSNSRWTPFEAECLIDLQRKMSLVNSGPSAEHSFDQSVSTSDSTASAALAGNQGLWDNFENTAQAIAALYRNPNWSLFQHAAAATTQFYKESTDTQQRAFEQGTSVGRQRLLKELLGFIKNSSNRGKVYIRRDELLSFLAGKSRPATSARAAGALHASPPRLAHRSSEDDGQQLQATALGMFHEALARASGGNSPARSSPSRSAELGSFLVDELKRHRKRRRHHQRSPGQQQQQQDTAACQDDAGEPGCSSNKRFRFK